MKLLMISEENLSNKIGVQKKIFAQAKAFSKLDFDVLLLYLSEGNIWSWQVTSGNHQKITTINGYAGILLTYYNICHTEARRFKPYAVYIRAPFTEYFYIRLLRQLNESGIKIIVEYATYPYDDEYKSKSFFKRNLLFVDRFFRKKLHKYVNYAVSYTDQTYIFNIPAIKIENGINLEDIPVRQNFPSDEIRLIGVANLSRWHGYDRVIEGLKIYYSNQQGSRKILFDVVGNGREFINLKKLVSDNHMESYVTFHGKVIGKELDKLFAQSNIGIGSLGWHRVGIKDAATIKAREYCARALPFVISYYDEDFTDKCDFVLNIPPTDDPVEMSSIEAFFEKRNNVATWKKMRDFAEKKLSWEEKLKKVSGLINSLP